MKRSALILSFLPLVFGCDNPKSPGHSCASVYSVSSAAASSFCATFTASTVTATTGVPEALLSNCDYKTKHLSSACSCLGTAAVPTVATPSSVVGVESKSHQSSFGTGLTHTISPLFILLQQLLPLRLLLSRRALPILLRSQRQPHLPQQWSLPRFLYQQPAHPLPVTVERPAP